MTGRDLKLDQEHYDSLYTTMEFLPGIYDEAARVAHKITQHQYRYKAAVEGLSMPWYVVALIHHMEASCNFNNQLINGEPYDQVTQKYPKGKGPWSSWEAAALWNFKNSEDAHVFQKTDWARWRLFWRLEAFNGNGYACRGLNTPYLWSGSNHGVGVGKFEERPPDYKTRWYPDAVSNQVGAALVYRLLVGG